MDDLLPYYERELGFLRRYSNDFAERYPKIAARLAMSADHCEDPHVERMIESFALLGARINKKLDDDYPEFTEALLEVMYPHYLRPFPSCSIAQFDESASSALVTEVATVARHTELTSRPIRGVACRFRTAYDVTLPALTLSHVAYAPIVTAPAATLLPAGATGSISITIEASHPGVDLAALSGLSLRVNMHGEPSLVAALSDGLFLNTAATFVEADRNGRWRATPSPVISEVGFDEEDALIEFPARSHPAYRLLTEYFAFPDKFNFFDIDLAALLRIAGPCRRLTLHLVLKDVRADSRSARVLETLTAANLRLGCTPVVNLFSQRGEPIRVTHTAVAYPVVADARRAFAHEVYSIDSVKRVRQTSAGDEVTEFRPFYALRHGESGEHAGHYWMARRDEVVAERSPGFETEISIVDLDLTPSVPQTDTLSLELTCTNRDLPAGLAFGLAGGDLFVEGGSVARTITMLRRPTPSARFKRGHGAHWRLISHLALNHLSLVQSGLPTLKEMLRLYDLPRTAVSGRQVEGLVGLDHKPAIRWLPGQPFATFVRGIEIVLTIDTDSFVGTSLHHFVRVMDRFFGLYVHVNSFIQLVVISKHTSEEMVRCAPRSGDSILV
jgi:type VI secretion system protein ImpG